MPRGLGPQPGDRYGKLLVLGRDASGTSRHPKFLMRCDCGKEYVVSGGTLSKNPEGCKECRPGGAKRKYGDRLISDTKLYHSWIAMRRRCNPDIDDERNARWGGRGITVCAEWEDYAVFEAWSLSHGYELGLSLDRVDNDGNYTPDNCEWVTRAENSRRARALYHFVPKAAAPTAIYAYPYDEPCYGDY